jgi:DNA polymerase III subunit alpha
VASSRFSAARSASPTTPRPAKGNAHLTLLAEDNAGYGNLIKLASACYPEGYYYKPRVDWELLQTHATGLIALSGLSGRVRKALEEARPADAAQRSSAIDASASRARSAQSALPFSS